MKSICYDVTMRVHKKRQATVQNVTQGSRKPRKTQTTLRLPRELYEQAKVLVERGKQGSVNDFIVAALSAYVRALERKAIDDAFRGMASDKQYQRETLRILKEFAASDAETLALSERDWLEA